MEIEKYFKKELSKNYNKSAEVAILKFIVWAETNPTLKIAFEETDKRFALDFYINDISCSICIFKSAPNKDPWLEFRDAITIQDKITAIIGKPIQEKKFIYNLNFLKNKNTNYLVDTIKELYK